MHKSAVISPDTRYRWTLERVWDKSLPKLVVIMTNPSTADAEKDDPTILFLCKWALGQGFGGITVVNLYGLRSSSPQDVVECDAAGGDPFGDCNKLYLSYALEYARENGGWALAAWGNNDPLNAKEYALKAARGLAVDLKCLGLTKQGNPKHPLARGKSRIPVDYKPTHYVRNRRRG